MQIPFNDPVVIQHAGQRGTRLVAVQANALAKGQRIDHALGALGNIMQIGHGNGIGSDVAMMHRRSGFFQDARGIVSLQ